MATGYGIINKGDVVDVLPDTYPRKNAIFNLLINSLVFIFQT